MTTFTLPYPVSVNGLFASGKTRRFKSQKYCDWLLEAGLTLAQIKPPRIIGPVHLHYILQEKNDKIRRDLMNFEKATTDLLVSHGIIEADDVRIVREITMKWSKAVEGIQVTIESLVNEEREVA